MNNTKKRILQHMQEYNAPRIEAIAAVCTGERAEAAKRVILKRAERLKWIQGGMSIEQAQRFVLLTYSN